MVSNSIKTYRETVIDALNRIYENPNLTVDDFDRPFISKLLADDLVAAHNISLLFFGREGIVSCTYLKLTPQGCHVIEKPFIFDRKPTETPVR